MTEGVTNSLGAWIAVNTNVKFLFGRLGGQLVALGTSLRIISSGSTPAPGWISAEY